MSKKRQRKQKKQGRNSNLRKKKVKNRKVNPVQTTQYTDLDFRIARLQKRRIEIGRERGDSERTILDDLFTIEKIERGEAHVHELNNPYKAVTVLLNSILENRHDLKYHELMDFDLSYNPKIVQVVLYEVHMAPTTTITLPTGSELRFSPRGEKGIDISVVRSKKKGDGTILMEHFIGALAAGIEVGVIDKDVEVGLTCTGKLGEDTSTTLADQVKFFRKFHFEITNELTEGHVKMKLNLDLNPIFNKK